MAPLACNPHLRPTGRFFPVWGDGGLIQATDFIIVFIMDGSVPERKATLCRCHCVIEEFVSFSDRLHGVRIYDIKHHYLLHLVMFGLHLAIAGSSEGYVQPSSGGASSI